MDCGGGEPDLWQVDDLEARYLGDGLVDREPGVDADPAVGGVVVVRDRGPATSTPAASSAANS